MAYQITLSGAADSDGPETFALCSIGAWGEFRGWARGLDDADYGALKTFASSGSCRGTDELAKELLDAQAIDPPDNPGVRATLDRLIELVGEAGDPAETATIEE